MAKDDGGPAFPVEVSHDLGLISGKQTGSYTGWATGLTIRDWFAGQALMGIIAHPAYQPDDASRAGCAQLAYEFSDAMLAERAKK